MENKYYTPEIEEFHIGFEYEWLDTEGNWNKESSPKEISQKGFEEQTYGLRVKFLDIEDIGSLGWKINGNLSFNHYYFKVNFETHWFFIVHKKSGQFVFDGVIKNKSELKKVMKMIGITN